MEFTFDLVDLALAAKPPDWGNDAPCPQGARRANTLPYLTNEQRGGQGCIGAPIPHELLTWGTSVEGFNMLLDRAENGQRLSRPEARSLRDVWPCRTFDLGSFFR